MAFYRGWRWSWVWNVSVVVDSVERMFDTIPPGLDDMDPGPVLAAFLSSVDVDDVVGYDRIVILRAHQRMASHYSAMVYKDMGAVADALDCATGDPVSDGEAAEAEIRAALQMTRRTADREMGLALELRGRLPQVWAALAAGRIDVPRARVIAMGTVHLEDAKVAAVVDKVVEAAPRLTTGQLRARLARLCMEVDPEDAARRYETSVEDRRIGTEPDPFGTCSLSGLNLSPERVAAATSHINHLARQLSGPAESRTIDQLRADIFLDLLIGRHAGRGRTGGAVEITVDLSTLAELNAMPGDLAGYGPVIADIARKVAQDQVDEPWLFTVTDSVSGQVLHTGTTRRRPNRAQSRHVTARNRTCIFPGCRMPARQSDLDHRRPWAQTGVTDVDDLAPMCRHDHCIHHAAGWSYELARDGTVTWTSRLGHTYVTSGRSP